jgi:rhodanese-related sulfurtransferase
MATRIDLGQLQELLDGGDQLVEVRPAAEYADEHLPGHQPPPQAAGRHHRTPSDWSLSVSISSRTRSVRPAYRWLAAAACCAGEKHPMTPWRCIDSVV